MQAQPPPGRDQVAGVPEVHLCGRPAARPLDHLLAVEQRVRLHVATSDFPVFLLHPGTDENPWDATETRTNRQTLATGGEPASYVSLTVL